MPKSSAENLISLLEREREAVLAADFESVARIGDEKIEALENFKVGDANPEEISVIQVEIAHNQTLLAAAISGIGNANARLKELAQVRDGLSTYTNAGKISQVSLKPPVLERKA